MRLSEPRYPSCEECSEKISLLNISVFKYPVFGEREAPLCESCLTKKRAREDQRHRMEQDSERVREQQEKELKRELARIMITTADSLPQYRIMESLDIITAECAFVMNIFKDFFSAMSDIVGGRSRATQKVLRDARLKCLEELRKEAHDVGANAAIAIRLDYSEFSGGGLLTTSKSMLFLVASGTAVKAVKVEEIESS